MNLEKVIKNFLIEHSCSLKPFLLGLSGGPDSLALFYLLLQLKNENKLSFAVAHVNHNWRKESSEEAHQLKLLAHEAQVSFHLHELDPEKLKGNLEEACRKERLNFFKSLTDAYDYQAVFLAHHLNDQAETVLKRIFEGAFLPRCQGLSPVKEIDGLTIFRPFLKVQKAEIEKWLKEKGIQAFEDPTNQDSQFMRARFRERIVPFLSKTFGKEIDKPLYRFGNQSFELDQYLKKAFFSYEEKIVKGFFGSYFTFPEGLLPFEIKYLIRMFAEKEEVLLTYPLIEAIASFIESIAPNKQIEIEGKKLFVDRGTLFCLKDRNAFPFDGHLDMDTSSFNSANLSHWKITLSDGCEGQENWGWEEAFKGELSLKLLPGKYRIAFSDHHLNLKKLWSNAKVPAFLRGCYPLVIHNQQLYADSLSKKKPFFNSSQQEFFKLDLCCC